MGTQPLSSACVGDSGKGRADLAVFHSLALMECKVHYRTSQLDHPSFRFYSQLLLVKKRSKGLSMGLVNQFEKHHRLVLRQ